MYTVRKSEEIFVQFSKVQGKNISVVRAEIFCDSASDLPAVDAMEGTEFAMGSIAYCIEEGKLYVLNSSGTWKISEGDSNARSLMLSSPSPATKQTAEIEQPEEKELEILETEEPQEKGAEEDDKLIRDTENK